MNFEIDAKQMKLINDFHPDCKKKYTGAIGGGEKYTFMTTSLGTIIIYTCKCGEEINVTDFDNW